MKKIVRLHFVFSFNKHPRKDAFLTHFFLQTMNFYWIWERITFKIINLSISISPENLSTSALLSQIHNWKAPHRWPVLCLQHCPNAFTLKIFLLNHPQPRKFAEIVRWVLSNTHTQKNHQPPRNWNEARNERIYEVIHCFTAFLLIFPILPQQSLGFHRQSPWRLSGRVTYPAPDGYK